MLQIVAFQLSFSQFWWKCPILEGSLIQKPTQTMNKAPSFFFFLSSLACWFKKNHLSLGLNFTYEFEVCCKKENIQLNFLNPLNRIKPPRRNFPENTTWPFLFLTSCLGCSLAYQTYKL